MSTAKTVEDRPAPTRNVAIVTGASRGIGRATAIRLAADFAAVALVARDAAGLATTAAEIREAGADALPVVQDLRMPEAADRVVEAVISQFSRVDALINAVEAARIAARSLLFSFSKSSTRALSVQISFAPPLSSPRQSRSEVYIAVWWVAGFAGTPRAALLASRGGAKIGAIEVAKNAVACRAFRYLSGKQSDDVFQKRLSDGRSGRI